MPPLMGDRTLGGPVALEGFGFGCDFDEDRRFDCAGGVAPTGFDVAP